jgi:hypothetical protein
VRLEEKRAKMGVGVFTDKKHQPTDAEVRAVIGSSLPLWQELVRHIRADYPVQEDLKFLYGKTCGWALAIARAHPYPEGRWLFISVKSEQDLQDAKRLLVLTQVLCNQRPKCKKGLKM